MIQEVFLKMPVEKELPEEALGITIFGYNKQGEQDTFSWDNQMQFHRPGYYDYGELNVWLKPCRGVFIPEEKLTPEVIELLNNVLNKIK